MEKFEEELIIKLGRALETIRGQVKNFSSLEEGRNRYLKESGLYSAMIADISEKLFGKLATKSPKFFANVHCGWACGPGGLLKGECYVEAFYRIRKEDKANDWIVEWKKFLENIRVA